MRRQYANPPLIEAVCEFRFEPGDSWDLAIPGLLYKALSSQFPKRRQVRLLESTIAAKPEGIWQTVSQEERLQCLREDETALVQVGPHLLSVNHLKPYPQWKGFVPLIREALHAYRGVANPKGLQRIGLRYINRIEIPEPNVPLERYFDFYPFVGSRLPQGFFQCVVRIHVPFYGGRDVLRLALSDEPGKPTFILDLDYFLGQPGKVAFEDVFQWLDAAHDRVEEAFEGCVKDSLRERFGEVKVS